MKDSKYVKVYGVNPLYLIFNKVNGYFKEINGNKYLTLVSTNETKEKRKKYEELWSKIRDLIWMKNNIMIQKDDYVTKLQCVQNHYVLGSTKQMGLLKFMIKLDIQCYLITVIMMKFVIRLNIL